VAVALSHEAAEHTLIERAPIHREALPVQLSRLLEAHEPILKEARHYAKKPRTPATTALANDLLISSVVRTNQLQVWFASEHPAASPVEP
jgi:starvation-inducible DNA-binding protein